MSEMTKKRNILVCGAWPYANGSLHIGHVAALIAGDIVARYHRLLGDNVLYVSGSDQHGTPIAASAEKEGVTPAEVANRYHEEFVNDFERLGFSYDNYTKTTNPLHAKVVQEVFLDLYHKGAIYKKTQQLLYCPHCQRFLPDRYVEGACPKCRAVEARGDQCDKCGSLLDATELIDPQCKICGTTPVLRESEHFFLKLSEFGEFLRDYITKQGAKGHWRANAVNFSLGLIKEGLPDRAITRDSDWGIDIPLPDYKGKCIYVWFEAVTGYYSASIEWAEKSGQPSAWEGFWKGESKSVYAHGKDNIPFHTIIWPSILKAKGGLNLPTQILSTEYVTFEGKQLSTSRNWAVWVPDFLDRYDPDSLRYYSIAYGPETADADFSWRVFVEKVNGELVGFYGNFVHRVLSFIYKNFGDKIPTPGTLGTEDKKVLVAVEKSYVKVGGEIERGRFKAALREVISLARLGNQYIDRKAPWKQVKENKDEVATTLWVCVQIIRALAVLTGPFLPRSASELLDTLQIEQPKWEHELLEPEQKFKEPKPLFTRIDPTVVEEELVKPQTSS